MVFDIIVMDFTMPVMGGEQAARIIRNDGFNGLIIGMRQALFI